MTSPSSREPLASELKEALDLEKDPRVIIQWAATWTLEMAMEMLWVQILSRRAMIGTGQLTAEAVDATSREIQRRVDRVRLIVAELRGRGVEVEWDE